ncbi:hypothetical protein MTR_2g055310 [Medicago truncatula]|uniref:Uncharacterized protein n=1 Tax=Medicago truncatula TaxID=3880 RepID=A0A072V9E6_MEDTR|nr:hypothetical protein MTR_2g055310 [Medicago truncatula]
MKTAIDWYRIGLRCKHESYSYGCYLSNAVGLTSKRIIELELWSNYCTTTLSDFEMKTGIDWHRIRPRCKHIYDYVFRLDFYETFMKRPSCQRLF